MEAVLIDVFITTTWTKSVPGIISVSVMMAGLVNIARRRHNALNPSVKMGPNVIHMTGFLMNVAALVQVITDLSANYQIVIQTLV